MTSHNASEYPDLSLSYMVSTEPSVGFLPWANPDNIISFETYETIANVCNLGLYPLLFVVGVPSNIINCLVFWRQGLRERMNLCLLGLALVDMSYLLVMMVQACSSFISLVDETVGARYYAYSLVYCLGIGWGFKAASGCISMLIAIERCLCVMYPLRVESLMRTRTMAVLLVLIVVSMQLAQVVQPIAYTAVSVHDVSTGEIHWNIVSTKVHEDNKVVFDFILVALLPFIIPVISFVVVSFTTAVTVVKLKMAIRWRAASSVTSGGKGDQQGSLTKVLVLLSCVYIACSAPLVAVTLARLLIPDFAPDGRYSNICIAFHILGTVFTAVNSAVNFFVYYWRSTRFKQALHQMCACGKSKAATKGSGVTSAPSQGSHSLHDTESSGQGTVVKDQGDRSREKDKQKALRLEFHGELTAMQATAM